MKLFRESIIILGIYLIVLCSKIVKVENVETVSDFFLSHLAFFFIPAGVGLISSFPSLKDSLIPILLICIITTAIVIIVTGLTVQFIINFKSSKLSNRKE